MSEKDLKEALSMMIMSMTMAVKSDVIDSSESAHHWGKYSEYHDELKKLELESHGEIMEHIAVREKFLRDYFSSLGEIIVCKEQIIACNSQLRKLAPEAKHLSDNYYGDLTSRLRYSVHGRNLLMEVWLLSEEVERLKAHNDEIKDMLTINTERLKSVTGVDDLGPV